MKLTIEQRVGVAMVAGQAVALETIPGGALSGMYRIVCRMKEKNPDQDDLVRDIKQAADQPVAAYRNANTLAFVMYRISEIEEILGLPSTTHDRQGSAALMECLNRADAEFASLAARGDA